MGAINLVATMDGIHDTLISGGVTKRAYAYPVDAAVVPCAIVGYPTSLTFDMTFQRGSDTAVFPIWFLVGKVAQLASRKALSAILTGATGIKDKLDGTLGGVVQAARVTDCTVETVQLGAISYLAARFDLEVMT